MRHRVSSTVQRLLAATAVAGLGLAWTPALAAPNSGRLSFSFTNDFTTAYFFRGILQERYGLIMQPYGEVNVAFYNAEEDDPGPFTYVGAFGGIWTSWHSEKTLADGNGSSNLYEVDYYGGLKFGLWNTLELKTGYVAYTSPNGAFRTVQEVLLSAALDDSAWLGAFALNPSAELAIETDNTAFGPEKGQYASFNIRPSYTIEAIENYPIELAMPCTVGLGIDDYFESANSQDRFGYFRGGLTASIPLAFIPEDYGSWSFTAGASVYAFGSKLQRANLGDTPWVVGTWSIGMTY